MNEAMEMKRNMQEVMELTKEVKSDLFKLIGCNVEDLIEDMDPETFKLMKNGLKLVELSMTLMQNQINVLAGIDEKLDKLLEKKD